MSAPLWLIPPAAGAVIGYVTNAVAIKMLFRPLEAKRLLGVRIPFTPGVLPRQRHKLADSIGAMVERELLTPEILRTRLRRDDVREQLRQAVTRCVEQALTSPLAGHDETFRSAGPLFGSFVRSPVFEALFHRFFASLIEGNRSVRDLAGEDYTVRLGEKLETLIREYLDAVLPGLEERFFPAMRGIFPAFIRFLNREEIHREMEIQGRIFLNNAILKLNVFQRFFISAGQYDKTLHDRMPEIIDDLIAQFEELFRDERVRADSLTFLRQRFRETLSDGLFRESLVRFLSDAVRSYLNRPLGDLLGSGNIRVLEEKILGGIKTNGAPEQILNSLPAYFREHRDISLSDLFPLDAEEREKLNSLLCGRFLEIADEQIPTLLGSINVRTLVSERINSLDMIDVER
ncbi:MAG: DUF445 family protein, partial [Spirochaetaceae bacterium]|nr:DUF445 family protein [Spirochaetaceae bacterium]